MDIRSFITSGILELYVNGLASPEEVREVEELATQHPEIQEEINAIREAMEHYVLAHGVQPPPGLKARILERAEGAPKTRPSTKTTAPAATAAPVSREAAARRPFSLAALAAWLFGLGLIAAGVAAYLFFTETKKLQAENDELSAQHEQLKQDCEAQQKKATAVQEQFIAIRHQATRPVPLKGTKLAEDAVAVVYWNNVRRTAFLDVLNLPEPPEGKQYQLWAIVSGKPADMGVFELKMDTNDLLPVPFVENPQAFAVTLEPAGGSENPTLDQMYVVGSVKG